MTPVEDNKGNMWTEACDDAAQSLVIRDRGVAMTRNADGTVSLRIAPASELTNINQREAHARYLRALGIVP